MDDAQGPGTEVAGAVQAACDECFLAMAQARQVEPFAVFGPPVYRGGEPMYRMADLRPTIGGWPLPDDIWSAAVADLCELGGYDEVAVAYPVCGVEPAAGGSIDEAVRAAVRAAAGGGPAESWLVVHHQAAGGPVRSFRSKAEAALNFVEFQAHLASGPATALTLVRRPEDRRGK